MNHNDLVETIKSELRSESNIMGCEEYRATMIAISDVAAEVVKKTLGPYGTTTVVEDGTVTYPTKDGLHTLQNLRFGDGIYNSLFAVMMYPCLNSANRVGDGTTTAMVLANHLMHTLYFYMEQHPEVRQSDLINAINEVAEDIISNLKNSKDLVQIDRDGDFSDIRNVAMISSNGNEQISDMIQKIYQETHNPDIYIETSPLLETHMEIQQGYQFNCRPIYLKPYINSDEGAYKVNESGAIAYFFDHGVNYTEHRYIIEGISRYANTIHKQAILFSPNFDSVTCKIITDAIDSFAMQGKLPVITLVQMAYVNELDRNTYEDLRILTGCQIFDYPKVKVYNRLYAEEMGIAVEKTTEDALYGTDAYSYKNPGEIVAECTGKIVNMSLHHNYAMIDGYDKIANPQLLKNHIDEVRAKYEETKEKVNKSTNVLQKDYLRAHLHYVKLSGSMGRINVGGNSVEEKKYLYDVVEDAVSACRAAFYDGTIHGMNITTVQTIFELAITYGQDDWYGKNRMKKEIAQYMYAAFLSVSKDILANKFGDAPEGYPLHADTSKLSKETINKIISDCKGSISLDDLIRTGNIVPFCGEYGLTYNMMTNALEENHHTVVNPITTDIEIIRSTIGILATVFTSNQFLSTRRHYDKVAVQKIKEQEAYEKLAKEWEIKGRAFMTGAMSPDNSVGIINSISINMSEKTTETEMNPEE